MCGITGLTSRSVPDLASAAMSMRDVFPYRGPDDKGIWIDSAAQIALGHRRLSILDPTPAGHQPMVDDANGLVIVFNGEVYNYIEIREELEPFGHRFTTGTDTEVILKAYAQWGPACLDHFNGMFAIAIYSRKTRQLFLARDRLGIKPLYYFENRSGFYFASEVKAILKVLPRMPEINTELIDAYMSFGYVPGEDTMLKGIKRLLPGHFMMVDVEGHKVSEPKKYWDLEFENHEDRGEAYYLEQGRALLNSAIDLRLRSDVPLGIFLSGGLDSSSVVGLLAPRVTEQLKTFSVAYDFGSDFNETPYARLVAGKFETDHHEVIITPGEFRDFIPQFIYLMDEPVTESAAISLYYVSKLAKEHVTVVLSGEGSDEIFAGYDLYQYMPVLEKYYSVCGRAFAGLVAQLGEKLLPGGSKLAKYLSLGAMPLEQRYKGISTYEERMKKRLYSDDFSSFCTRQTDSRVSRFLNGLFSRNENADTLSRMLYFDTKTWLVDDLLIKADRMSMAASLELRVPFLDYKMVEFAACMPSRYKICNRQGKYLLKKMMQDILPKEIIHRKKMGFPTPLKMMFAGELYDYAHDMLLGSSTSISSYFSRHGIETVLSEHKQNEADHHRVIWQLIVLGEWLKKNV